MLLEIRVLYKVSKFRFTYHVERLDTLFALYNHFQLNWEKILNHLGKKNVFQNHGKQANLHGSTVTWNNSNELMLHKQLIKWRKDLVWIPYWERKRFNSGRTLESLMFISMQKKSTSWLLSFLRYRKDITDLLFWALWAYLATTSKNNAVSL